jgi:hypothetical protein
VGKVVQPLQSVNCHDSRAHGHERQGPSHSLWSMVGLAAGVRPVSSIWFSYRVETCELCLVLAIGVRPVSRWPWVTIG